MKEEQVFCLQRVDIAELCNGVLPQGWWIAAEIRKRKEKFEKWSILALRLAEGRR